MGLQHLVALTGMTAVLLSALGIYVALRNVRTQLWLQMYTTYTGRHAEVVAGLPAELRTADARLDCDVLGPEERQRVLRAVRSYLHLCAEEYYLHVRGHVDEETWAIWKRGMELTMALPSFRETWALLRPEFMFHERFCDFVDRCEGDQVSPVAVVAAAA